MAWDALLPPLLVLVGAGALAVGVRVALAGLRLALTHPRWLGGAALCLLAGLGFLASRGVRGWAGGWGQAHLVVVVAAVLAASLAYAIADARRWRRTDRRVDAYAHWRRQGRLR